MNSRPNGSGKSGMLMYFDNVMLFWIVRVILLKRKFVAKSVTSGKVKSVCQP